MLQFSVGKLYTLDSNSFPIEYGKLQDVSLDMSWDMKELYARGQMPVALARGKGKIEGKAGYAEIYANALNILTNGTQSAGSKIIVDPAEAATIPASTPWTITVANAATFTQDLGVYDVSNPAILTVMKRVASGPTSGQYSVSAAGVYTFNTADASKAVQITYEYSSASLGQTVKLGNPLMGSFNSFSALLYTTYNSKQLYFKLPMCVSSKLSIAIKMEDFVTPDVSFSAYCDSSGCPCYIYMAE